MSNPRSLTSLTRILFVVTLLMILGSLAGAQNDVVQIGLSVEPGSLDLHADTTTASLDVNQGIYETLLRFDHDMNLEPWLATSWEQLDEQTYRFELREGVSFHSGHPFNAEAVKAHFERMTHPENPGLADAYLRFIEETTIIDDYTIEVALGEPFGPFLAYMALPFTAIQDTQRFEEIGDQFGVEPSGTGPFMMDAWDRGSAIRLRANPNYWGGEPDIDGIEFRIIPEAGPRSIALQQGEIHATTQVSLADAERLGEDPNINVSVTPEPRRISWLINLEHPHLSDLNVRRALAHAVDYELAVEAVLGEFARPLRGFVTPESFGYLETPYEYDPERATNLLEESGWQRNAQGIFEQDGQTLTIEVMTGDVVARELEVIEALQSLFREFGVLLEIDRIEGAQLFPNIARFADMYDTDETPDFGVLVMNFGMRTGEANIGLDTTFKCSGSRNASQYCNEEFDALLDIATSGAPDDEREEAYHQALRLLYEDVPAINLWQPMWVIAIREGVENLELHPAGVWFYENLSLKP